MPCNASKGKKKDPKEPTDKIYAKVTDLELLTV